MERVIQLINRMQTDGVISDYAIGGGIAAVYYLEPYHTDDLEIFIPVSPLTYSGAGSISLESIYTYLKSLGYAGVREGVSIEDWLVRFRPTVETVQEEALTHARRGKYRNTTTRIFSPEHLTAELLRSGRLKDQVPVIALVQSGILNTTLFSDIISRHNLGDKWAHWAKRYDVGINESNDFDLSQITVEGLFRAKEARRKRLAKLPFEEKIQIVRRLQSLSRELEPLRAANRRERADGNATIRIKTQ